MVAAATAASAKLVATILFVVVAGADEFAVTRLRGRLRAATVAALRVGFGFGLGGGRGGGHECVSVGGRGG